jgi:mono/diheme cytochrome c family protein/HEAT repeat protein
MSHPIFATRQWCGCLLVAALWLMPTSFAQFGGRRVENQTPIPGLPKPPPSPVLSPQEALKTFQIAAGFKIELIASEPSVQDPITMAFDEDGRLFVVEMRGFMPNIDREGELDPTGRISRLEDSDQDGRFEKAVVFADKLVLPRAVAAVNGGILFVSASKLWFAQDTDGDGRADRTELVDPAYASFGNVEHAPNGLMRALDNWIYNAKSQYRYRLINGVWIKQRTEFRGQWGITQDNYGRLLYNVNYSQLLGDVVPPNYMGRNAHHKTASGLNVAISTNQHIFPIRMNTSVNRGYRTNILDQAGRLREFASSCSPLVYRGDNFPAEFQGNAFVCDPSANLIKRNLVFDHGLAFTSKFAYERAEFLASTDERFRPVNIFNGPDGGVWIVDMYRGIVQYGAFMTTYLRRDILERGLDKPINLGRIYRVVSTSKAPAKTPRLSKESSQDLVGRLSHPNGWVRDTAQRLLVERGDRSVARELSRLAVKGPDPLGRIHALWTLEGLFVALPKDPNKLVLAQENSPAQTSTDGAGSSPLKLFTVEKDLALEVPSLTQDLFDSLIEALGDSDPKVQIAAIRVLESLAAGHPQRQKAVQAELAKLEVTAPLEVSFQATLSTGSFPKPDSLAVLASVASRHSEHTLMRDAILSGLQDWELEFLQRLLADPDWENKKPGRDALLQSLASAIIKERKPEKTAALLDLLASQKTAQIWRQRSLLDGITANTQNQSFEPISMVAAPAAFQTLGQLNDPKLKNQVERIKNLFAWPGHAPNPAAARRNPTRQLTPREEMLFHESKVYYQQTCAVCHGVNGEGMTPLAPPLVNSEWVLGPESRLIRIVLNGLEGPIHVNGTRYEPPLILPEMPSAATLEDSQIAAILSYIRREWGHEADPISFAQVARIRREVSDRQLQWTEDELLQIK